MTHHDPTADETVVELSTKTRTLSAVEAWNSGASAAFLQLFSMPAASVALGTTVPDWVIAIPATGGRDPAYAGGAYPAPLKFSGGLSYAVTSTAGGSGAPSADVVLSIAFF